MKKLFLVLFAMLIGIGEAATAQEVTKFLGIPVEGPSWRMTRALLKKGYERLNYDNRHLRGIFNGRECEIFIVTGNGGDVFRIIVKGDVGTAGRTAADYNDLLLQFNANDRYIEDGQNRPIPPGEDVYRKMVDGSQEYRASFLQNPADTAGLQYRSVWFRIELEPRRERLRGDMAGYSFGGFGGASFDIRSESMPEERFSLLLYYDNLLNSCSEGEGGSSDL